MGNNKFYRPVVMWFINGPFNNKKIIKQIRVFSDLGFNGVLPIPVTNHPLLSDLFGKNNIREPYLSEKYFEHYAIIVKECRRRKMKVWIWDDVFCPSGWAGGEIVNRYPYLRGVVLRRYRKRKENVPIDCKIFHEDSEYFYVIVSTDVNRTDILNPETTQRFIEINYESYRKYFQNDFGKTIVGFFTDEPGAAGCINGLYKTNNEYISTCIPWSKDFDKRFNTRYGYALKVCLKYLFGYSGSSEEAKRARDDFANFVQNSFAENYMLPLRKWCHKHNLLYMGHLNNDERLESSLISNGNLLKQLRIFDIPGIDAIGRQLTPGKENLKVRRQNWDTCSYNSNYIKFASSAANLNRTQLSLSEIGDCYGFGMTIDDYKWLIDYHLVRGINLFALGHVNYSNKGFAVECSASHYGEGNPLWPFYKKLNDYVHNISKLLSRGTPDIKNAIWNPITTIFREKTENINEFFESLCTYLQIEGADFDIIGPEEVKGKKLPYHVIFIPVGTTLTDEERRHLEICAKKIKICTPHDLKLRGAITYFPYIIDYKNYKGSFEDYAQNVYYGLKEKCFKDIDFGKFRHLRFIKRKFPKNNILYFLFNESDREDFQGIINFNEKGYHILLVDIEKNKFQLKDDKFFKLRAKQSLAVMLTKNISDGINREKSEGKYFIQFSNQWKIAKGKRVVWDGKDFKSMPVKAVEIMDSIKKGKFSGWVEYENYFEDICNNLWISFKELKYAALIKVNDRTIGEVAWSPYEIEIDKRYIYKGMNKISITVFNTLADYVRSKDFEKLLKKYCSGYKNIYFKITSPYDQMRKGIGFKLRSKAVILK